jgi:hypothetical protein
MESRAQERRSVRRSRGIGAIIRAHGEPKMRWLHGDDLYVAGWTDPNSEQHDYCPSVRKVNPGGGVTMVGTVPN